MNQVCLAACFLRKTKTVCDSLNALGRELSKQGFDLVLISWDKSPMLEMQVVEMPTNLISFKMLFRNDIDTGYINPEPPYLEFIERDAAWIGSSDLDHKDHMLGYYAAKTVMSLLVDTIQPSIIMPWGGTATISRMMELVAKEKGIPTRTIERGLIPGTIMIESNPECSHSDLIENNALSKLMEQEISAGEFSALFDFYQAGASDKYDQPEKENASDIKFRLGINGAVVALLGQNPVASGLFPRNEYSKSLSPIFDSHASIINSLSKALSGLDPGATIVFKPHPLDGANYKNLELPKNVIVDTNINLRSLISMSDAVSVLNSTAQFEALFFGKPVILLGKSQISGKGIAYECRDENSVSGELCKALKKDSISERTANAKKFLVNAAKHFLYSFDASVPLAASLEKLASAIKSAANEFVPNADSATSLHVFNERFKRSRLVKRPFSSNSFKGNDYISTLSPSDTLPDVGVTLSNSETQIFKRELMYKEWVKKRQLTDYDLSLFSERINSVWEKHQTIHFIIPFYDHCNDDDLKNTIASIEGQLYTGWGITVVSSRHAQIETRDNIELVTSRDDIDGVCLTSARNSPADWVSIIDCGNVLSPKATFACADYADAHPEWHAIYTDDDVITSLGERALPKFKPGINVHELRSHAYTYGLQLFKKTSLIDVLGDDEGIPHPINYDLSFRFVEMFGEIGFGHIPDILMHVNEANDTRINKSASRSRSEIRCIEAHLSRAGISAVVKNGIDIGTYKVEYIHNETPMVSIIIPTKDALGVLRACVESLVKLTDYSNYEVVIVDNNSEKPETLDFFNEITAKHAHVRVLPYKKPYNFSAENNYAVDQTSCEYVVLLNNDTQITHPNWLKEMLSIGMLPSVGIVGAKLFHPDGTIQHSGVVVGLSGVADHPNLSMPGDYDGYLHNTNITRGMEAVTAACMLVRKEVYTQLGGLDETIFAVLFNDVDLCLKARSAGYDVVWTPHAKLMHHGSFSLKKKSNDDEHKNRSRKEALAMLDKWLPILSSDSSYNKNLNLMDKYYQPEIHVDSAWDTHRNDRYKVMAFPFDSWGTGHYRVRSPLEELQSRDVIRCALMPNHSSKDDVARVPQIVEIERARPDAMLLHTTLHDIQLQLLEQSVKYNNGVYRVFGLDDLAHAGKKDSIYKDSSYKDINERLSKALSLCDRLVVSTQPIADACRNMIDDIVVIPNSIDKKRWGGLLSKKRQSKKPRIGWAGALNHGGDLGIIAQAVRATSKHVDWVFMGDKPKGVDNHIKTFCRGVYFDEYPSYLASLNLDMAIAPLEITPFNEAKSNLKLLEYGILGIPVIASNILPYHGSPATLVENTANAWISAILDMANDLDSAESLGRAMKAWVEANYMLESHLESWVRALMRGE